MKQLVREEDILKNRTKILFLEKYNIYLEKKELDECQRSLFYLGKAISRFYFLTNKKGGSCE